MLFRRNLSLLAGALLVAGLAACTNIGPGTIARDRFDYTDAVAESWKRQMLLNIVKIRYGDAPIFLDVTSIINQYSMENEVNASLGWSAPPYADDQRIGGIHRYADRPTISYNLLTGEKFARSLMTPVKPVAVMSMVEGGYPIDLVFRLLLHSINGIQNQYGGTARLRAADPEFYPLIDRLREAQSKGSFSLRVKKIDDHEALIMIFRKKDQQTEVSGREIRQVLGLKDTGGEFRVVYGSAASTDDEIALLTRSILEILVDISASVEVPPEHVAEQRVSPTMAFEGDGIKPPLVRIHSSASRPAEEFVAVEYRGIWFWIDDRDLPSKKLFSFLMFIMTLTESGGKDNAPIMTISAG